LTTTLHIFRSFQLAYLPKSYSDSLEAEMAPAELGGFLASLSLASLPGKDDLDDYARAMLAEKALGDRFTEVVGYIEARETCKRYEGRRWAGKVNRTRGGEPC
jgi:hypothetical protein